MDLDPKNIFLSQQEQDTIRWPFPVTPRDSADDLLEHIEEEFGTTGMVLQLRELNNLDDFTGVYGHLKTLKKLDTESIERHYENMEDIIVRIGELIAPDIVEELIVSTRP